MIEVNLFLNKIFMESKFLPEKFNAFDRQNITYYVGIVWIKSDDSFCAYVDYMLALFHVKYGPMYIM